MAMAMATIGLFQDFSILFGQSTTQAHVEATAISHSQLPSFWV
jgi:hypothetical protein